MPTTTPATLPLLERTAHSPIVALASDKQAEGHFPFFRTADGPSAPYTSFDGIERINLGSNNYLGLANDERVIDATIDAIRNDGTGLTGSRLMNGTSRRHEHLEDLIASFTGKEAALVFSTGFGANLGALTGLLDQPGDIAYFDAEAHASLIDGLRMSGADMRRVRHAHLDHLERLTATHPDDRAGLLVVDGVYSMRGDAPNLADITRTAHAHGIAVYDDEAHGLGVLGATGIGAAERDGADVDIIFYTFSKSLASCGGAVVGDRQVIDHLRLSTRPFLFTASNTPGSLATATTALELLIAHPEWPGQVRALATHLVDELSRRGVPTNPTDSAIVTIPTGELHQTLATWRRVFDAGVFVNAVLSPAVRADQCLLRLSVMRTHDASDLTTAAAAIAAALP